MSQENCNAAIFKTEDERLFFGFSKSGAWYWERLELKDFAFLGVNNEAVNGLRPGETVGLSFGYVSVVPWVEGWKSDSQPSSSFLLDGLPVLSPRSKTFARRCVDALRAFVTGSG